MLALRLGWTEQQVDAADPDLVGELLAYFQAEDQARAQRQREQARRGHGG